MTFADLYGDRLDRELGSSDRTALFTTARRKAAINEAQRWFITQTECLTLTAEIALVDALGEYDLEDEILGDAFLQIATKRSPHIKAVPASGDPVYLTGPDFTRRAVEWLDRYEPGWRGATAGTPAAWYERPEGGQRFIGLTPAPAIPAGAVWTLYVPYVVDAAAMVADGDLPFTVEGDAKRSLIPWHDALGYYAGSELEKLRKGLERSAYLMKLAEGRVLDFLDKQRVPGGKAVTVARDYRREARGRGGFSDYGPYDDPRK